MNFADSSPWHYKCEGGLCKKELITRETISPVPLEICELFCGASSSLWPKATGHLSLSKKMVHLDPEKISLVDTPVETQVEHLLERNVDLLRENAKNLNGKLIESGGAGMVVRLTGLVKTDRVKLTLHTDESYSLTVTQVNETVSRLIL